MKRRDANLILVGLGALGGGIIILSLPVALLEKGVVSSGLPTILPSAAPPLGGTAHMMLATLGALLCALLTAVFLPWPGAGNAHARQMGGAGAGLLARLVGLMRRRLGRAEDICLEYYPEADRFDLPPMLSRSDAHPDAPARSPLFARRDLGDAVLPPVGGDADYADSGTNAMPEPVVRDITGLSMPRAPEPLPWDLIEQEMSRALKGVHRHEPEEESSDEADGHPTDQPTIGELAERLEKGLARRRAWLANGERESSGLQESAVEGEEMADLDMPAPEEWDVTGKLDEELERALAALRSITKRAG